MNENIDVYAISGRIKNMIAVKDLALSTAGLILVNTYTMVLKDLHDFAEKLPEPYKEELHKVLIQKEGLPEYVIHLSTPQQENSLLIEEQIEYDETEAEDEFVR